MCHLDAAVYGDHRRLSLHRRDGDGAHLVVKAIVFAVVHDEMKDVSDRLIPCLEGRDVTVEMKEMVLESER